MKANDTSIKSLIEGVKQFLIPVYQRTFAWNPDERKTKAMTVVKMWDDIHELLDNDEGEIHFFGSIVTMPAMSSASEVSKFIVIDGQQRLISTSLLLAAIRDTAKEAKVQEGSHAHFVEKLEEGFLLNRLREGEEKYKVVPTRSDKEYYFSIVNGEEPVLFRDSKIARAYRFFLDRVRKEIDGKTDPKEIGSSLDRLQNVLLNRLRIVDVRLDADDDPHDVFESLNYTGIPLSNWDLVRNYILMHYKDPKKQEEMYFNLVRRVEDNIKHNDEEFLRDFINMKGKVTTSRNIYNGFKSLTPYSKTNTSTDWEMSMKELLDISEIYRTLVNTEEIENTKLRDLINFTTGRLKITTHFPVLMKLFKLYNDRTINNNQLTSSVEIVTSYLLRRSLSYSSQGLNKFFPGVAASLTKDSETQLRDIMTKGSYAAPDDRKFIETLKQEEVGYFNAEVVKYLLYTLEKSINKEAPGLEHLQLEHIMPRTLDEDWKNDLGPEWDRIHREFIDKLGNLTLTGYNQELQNFSFAKKKAGNKGKNGYSSSSIQITKELTHYDKWGEEEISKRGEELSNRIAKMWKI